MNLIHAIDPLEKGPLRVRALTGPADLAALLAVRGLCFRGHAGADDRDQYDDDCIHMVIERRDCIIGGFRLRRFSGAEIADSYSAQFYDLTPLHRFSTPMLELGRFCIDPVHQDADAVRLAWGAITQQVDRGGVGLLFGCSSFAGCDPAPYHDAFGVLRTRHLAPRGWAPGMGRGATVRFADLPMVHDRGAGLRALPPLLRTYLAMGGWVSDHAVIDRALGTVHVFTGLEIGQVPPGRARLLRAVAAGGQVFQDRDQTGR
ncbi:GNAT family N-acetyltransferase [Oceaniglobus ichthyenteri]|uniref:GNAT family N-acetyltransferase n=1 Tax=Oceaniglobus ichthyenteri TaxID=2136177 RepID=UPI000D35F617|nr:GNAT family N-acyltransferase [Oceaniglobus ichthyenteri]